ncbi:UDP-N-acetylmuramoyl-L-alanyl-D-glutamate--2,6-diaminopimelate ligase [Pararhizobium mangrovi]|uniref:UDP-N-acetylmuramoyl-L-alanyl-D-glutamate--2,6-diaminopimelate ligase n=1 Tax=Pararhizobium mangrovi TaxID=2590452 RepID=A0A506U852_9HYPH|nr:UDP-N-acetylmuramoyl-L-alanyl-D-glutamate--2,6-diaminopimelate ligase [Pararhizobium mangrovi]TPW29281.1 UDP-N-acetylmuramoyl-L-alanyl-D-glutamate--2,6-diaminopimelate ligase [Pararhizobium mangrovi]
MKLDELAGDLLSVGMPAGVGSFDIGGLSADSRAIAPGDLFVAIEGTHADGSTFARDAVERGAVAVVASLTSATEVDVPVLRTEDPRRFLALAAARIHPAQPETIVAVTGTAGKTSVASFTRQIWAHAGKAAAMIGTTGVTAPGRTEYGSLTTPDPVELHRLLDELAGEGVTHTAMEASSHGIDQHRLDGVRLAAGAFTNLGRDHMDYHETIETYFEAKMHLFDRLLPTDAPAVIDADGDFSQRAGEVARGAGRRVLTTGRNGTFLSLKRLEHQRTRQVAQIQHGDAIYEVTLPLAGDFQISNALVAAGLAMATGTPAEVAMEALGELEGAPGRLELVGATGDGAPVYVDYAHKPEALESVLSSVRPFTTGRVVVVFGCGGDRDRGKRPIMGEIAGRLADVVIVTDDNPRSEEPATIRSEIKAAVPQALEFADRREAIAAAVFMLKHGDTLIVAGKGHEPGQTIGTDTLPFSDHEEVAKALEALSA